MFGWMTEDAVPEMMKRPELGGRIQFGGHGLKVSDLRPHSIDHPIESLDLPVRRSVVSSGVGDHGVLTARTPSRWRKPTTASGSPLSWAF